MRTSQLVAIGVMLSLVACGATRAAAQASGVKKVENNLQIKPSR
jgi:hypothetical protein